MVREITRALLVTPPDPCGDPSSGRAAHSIGWANLAASLRSVGMQAEVYDAALLGRDLEAVGVQIEHFWPHLVITACETATATSAWAVLRAAKRIVPGVITVMSGPSAGPDTDDARYGVVADFDLRGSDEMTEAEVLAGLREGERPYGSVTPSTRGLGRLRALSAAWLFIAHGR